MDLHDDHESCEIVAAALLKALFTLRLCVHKLFSVSGQCFGVFRAPLAKQFYVQRMWPSASRSKYE